MYPIIKILSVLLLLTSPILQAATPQVVVTLKPIHSLVSGVMAGVGEPTLLLSGGESPHTYRLRPSTMRLLQKAEMIVYVSPQLESFLEKPLQTLPTDVALISLIDLPDLMLLPAREGGYWQKQADHHHSHHQESHEENHQANWDLHVWLDPKNAEVIVKQIAKQLATLDPDNAQHYQKNRDQLIEQLQKLADTIQKDLTTIKKAPFLVFHDAYQYFEKHFQLNGVGALSVSPAHSPSVQRIHSLREKIKSLNVRCIFSEPQFPSRLIQTLIEDNQARKGSLDPLGMKFSPGQEAYFQLMLQLANNMKTCLAKESD